MSWVFPELSATGPTPSCRVGPVCQDPDSVEEQVDLRQLLLDPRGKWLSTTPTCPWLLPPPLNSGTHLVSFLGFLPLVFRGAGWEGESTVAWRNLPLLPWSSAFLHLLTCLRAGLGASSTLTCLVPRAGWPLCTTPGALARGPSPAQDRTDPHAHSCQAAEVPVCSSAFPSQPKYLFPLSVSSVAKPCWRLCPKQAASVLREGVSGNRAQKPMWRLGFLVRC